jgi:hypothetical protein
VVELHAIAYYTSFPSKLPLYSDKHR